MTWVIRDADADFNIPDARENKKSYTLQELHNAVWFSADSPSDSDPDSGEWFRLADGSKAYLMTIDLDFVDDGSMMLKTEEE